MDWFRWHHGSVTDPKFRLVAKRAQASVAEVVAVWAFVLETASQNPERGAFGEVDAEALDLSLGLNDGTTARILSAMHDRALIADGRIPAWDKRQPKREDSTAAERQRQKRQREHELALAKTADVTGDASRTVTQCHAASRVVTPEEKRGEEKDQKPPQPPASGGQADEDDPKAKSLASITADALAAFNASPLVKPNGGAMPAENPKVGSELRQKNVRRCVKLAREIAAAMEVEFDREWWAGYFDAVHADDFWSGRKGGGPSHGNWTPDFASITRAEVMKKLYLQAASGAQ